MSEAIKRYRNVVDQPWGRMFYDLIYRQLDIPDDRSLEILDFGAGFCLTADHYAGHHKVTAVEPNEEMISLRVQNTFQKLKTAPLMLSFATMSWNMWKIPNQC